VTKRPEGRTRRVGLADRPQGAYIAVVRRGETATLRMLLESLHEGPGPVQVIWDRRLSERRRRRRPTSPDRRRGERRSPAPPGWLARGYFFAPCRTGGSSQTLPSSEAPANQ
jgi:hypothetical protein